MKKKIIIGNWKMNKTENETKFFIKELNRYYSKNKKYIEMNDINFGVAPSFISIPTIKKYSKIKGLLIVGQNMFYKNQGAFTGEISPVMLKAAGANGVILGHSERRIFFNETSKMVNLKAKAAINTHLTPVIAFGETLSEYKKGFKNVRQVIKKMVLDSTKDLNYLKIILAYEPVWAIGTGRNATPEYAEEICNYVKEITNKNILVIYGGSVNDENINKFIRMPSIDGVLVGGASLDVQKFERLIDNCVN